MTAPTQNADAKRLHALIRELGIRTNGPYKLTKGGTSPYLFDLKPVMLHAEAADLIGRMMLEHARAWRATHVGGRELGAVPLAALVARESVRGGALVHGFFVRKQAKEHGLRRMVEGMVPRARDRAVVLEDVTTSGGSAMDTVVELRALGVQVEGVVTIVDREEGARARFDAEKIPFAALFTLSDFPDVKAMRS